MVTVPAADWNTATIGGQYIHTKASGVGAQDNVSGSVNTDKLTRESWARFIEDQNRPFDGLIITGGASIDPYDPFGSHFTPRAYVNYTFMPGWTLPGCFARRLTAESAHT